mmetsp:Transcript_12333/g.34965  ORF Transcript_12333/g.34965 Transcript_12333/m.34965 type:complete len:208 (+) Transcript_12333:1382-2005(+)
MMTKAHKVWKTVWRASSRLWIKFLCPRMPSTKSPPKPPLKTSNASLPCCTAAETSISWSPMSVAAVASWICRMASAEERSISRCSSGSSPIWPVALLPTARWQNQQVCSLILRWPTSVSIRCMWRSLAWRSSKVSAKGAVSSRMARTSDMAWPSTSSSDLSIRMRWMPSSTPRKMGPAGEPLSASSAKVSMWQSESPMAPPTSPDIR